jgi:predicted metal-dependent peptidase
MNAKQVYDILKDEGGGGGGGGFDEHDWEGAKEMDAEAQKVLEKELEHAVRQGKAQHQKMNGKDGGGLDRLLDDITTPKVDWREELREFVKTCCASKDTSSWRRVNRRFLSSGVYMPSLIGETIGDVVLGVDTSGSIGGAQLAGFMSEAKAIFEEVRPSKVHLLYWDAEVAAHEEYEQGNMDMLLQTTKPKGGGGTSPSCVSKYLNDKKLKPECVIMLTDGYVGSDWGSDWAAPVLWGVFDNVGATAETGKTIHVEG